MDTVVTHTKNRYNLYNLEPNYRKFLIAENISPISIKNYLSDYRYFLGWLGKFVGPNESIVTSDISTLESSTIEEFRDYMFLSKLPLKTVNRRLSSLRKFFHFCVSLGYMSANPAESVRNVSKKVSERDHTIASYQQAYNKDSQLDAQELKDIQEFFDIHSR